MTESVEVLKCAFRSAWKPTPHLAMSELAHRYLKLSSEYSKLTGPPNFDLYPYLVQPLDDLSPDNPARVVVLEAGIQSGKSLIGMGFVVGVITAYPGPVIWVTSHDTKAEEFSKTRLDLMIRDDETIKSLVSPENAKNKNNTIKLKRFPGGTIKLVGAQSVSGLTSDSIKYVVIDEADDHAENVGKAGSSIELAINRQSSFGDTAKTLIVSSPKVAGQSEIDNWRKRGTDRRWLIPCPHCGQFQELQPCDDNLKNWRLVWIKGDYSNVHYTCTECGGSIYDRDKARFMRQGRWSEPTNNDADGTIESYWLNFMSLPLGTYSWTDFARQWDAAVDRMKAGDMDPMRTIINTRMARTFEDRGEAIDAHELQGRLEADWQTVPDGVQLITMATDVQGGVNARLETAWIGWGAQEEAWLLDYVVTPGEPSDPETWAAHDQLRQRLFSLDDGRRVPASVCFVDRGFSATEVLQYTLRRSRQRTYAIKGVDGTPSDAIITNLAARANLKKVKNAPYYVVKTCAASDAADAMLRTIQPGSRYLHIPEGLLKKVPNLLDMLTSEQRFKVRGKDGKVRVHWTKKREDLPNEAWDLLKYNIAARIFAVLSGFVFETQRRPVIVDNGGDITDEVIETLREIQNPVESKPRPVAQPVRRPTRPRYSSGWRG